MLGKLKGFFKRTPDIQWSVGKDFHVVYSPFPVINGVRPLGTSWERHSKYIVVRHGDMPKALGFVKDSQTLFIVCHCGARATYVEDNQRPRPNTLTAEKLAKRIKDDGLSTHISRIKLYACSGGAGGVDSFASQLALELLLRGYYRVELYAYLSTVTSLD